MSKTIVSFVGNNSSHAIYDNSTTHFPTFGSGGLYFGGANKTVEWKDTYQVPIRNSPDRFEWADWEVFSVRTSI